MVCTFLLFVLLLAWIPTIDALSWMIPPLLSRSEFFDKSAAIATLLPWGGPSSLANPDSICLPLRFLPVGGCWALKVTLSNMKSQDFSYFGIVDTGSPFLTCPDQALEFVQSTKYPTSFEQYGESTGAMVWKKASEVALSQVLLQSCIVLGVASPNVMRESGGIFVGLVEQDDNRPTVLQQFGYRCFSINFSSPSPSLVLDRHSILARNDPDAMQMLDLNGYGPDLFHYAVNCDELVLNFRDAVTGDVSTLSIPTSSLNRPVVAVLDTGLTGCIFSDSLTNELKERQMWREGDFVGAQVRLPTLGGTAVVLPSTEKYWHFLSFRLPWFDDEDSHPHIIALGNTFWAQTSSLMVDPVSRRAKVVGTETIAEA
jgi:hypothetical protein